MTGRRDSGGFRQGQRAELEDLNRALRERIINNAGSRGGVLEEIFAGVDLIEESEADRSFRAFLSLVLDPERSEAFDAAVEQLLGRAFAAEVPAEERTFLRLLLSRLQGESTQVRSSTRHETKGRERQICNGASTRS